MLANGWQAIICQCRGDWQFYCDAFYFPQWNTGRRMCWLCQASSTARDLSWTDCSAESGWRSTMFNHESFVKRMRDQGEALPILFKEVVGFRLECVMIDVLHTVDQGIASHIIGSIFWLLAVVRGVFGGRSMKEKVKRLDAKLQQWYKDTKCTSRIQGPLSVDKLRNASKSAKLKAKAAATRHVAKFALLLMQTFGTNSLEDRLALLVAQHLCEFYEILNSESMFLSESARKRIPTVGQQLAYAFMKLSSLAEDANQKLWRMVPKLHLWEHLTEWQALYHGNPRYFWTYGDEDLVGFMVEIAETCHPRTMAISTVMKWLHLHFGRS